VEEMTESIAQKLIDAAHIVALTHGQFMVTEGQEATKQACQRSQAATKAFNQLAQEVEEEINNYKDWLHQKTCELIDSEQDVENAQDTRSVWRELTDLYIHCAKFDYDPECNDRIIELRKQLGINND
jgi:hypothetical protein